MELNIISNFFYTMLAHVFIYSNHLFHNSIISVLYLNQSIKTNKGSKNEDIIIPTALDDRFDIVEVILLVFIFFSLGRLYQVWRFQRILNNQRG